MVTPIRFTPRTSLERIQEDRCRAAVFGSGRRRWYVSQCAHKPLAHSDWCGHHDPERMKDREEQRQKERERRLRADRMHDHLTKITYGLQNATVEQLRAELKRRGKKGRKK